MNSARRRGPERPRGCRSCHTCHHLWLWALLLIPFVPETGATEHEVKAAVLYKLATYVHWPDEAFEAKSSPFVLAVVGKGPFGDVLNRSLRGRAIDGRRIQVELYSRLQDVDEAHLVFIAQPDEGEYRTLKKHWRGRPVLLVGENRTFLKQGGIVRLFLVKGRLRFEIDNEVATRAGLRISSQLLKLSH